MLRSLGIAIAFCLSINAQGQQFVPGEFIVKLKGKTSSSNHQNFMGKVSAKMALKRSFHKLNLHEFKVKSGLDQNEVMNSLRHDPDVEYVEPNWIVSRFETKEENNKAYSLQEVRQLTTVNANDLAGYYQSGAPLNMEQAWAQSVGLGANPERPIVAVIDSGVDYNHPVFVDSGAIWSNSGETPNNGLDDDGNGYIDDVRGWNFYARNNNPMDDDNHGTHVAGIVLGASQDITALTVETARVRIMPLKFLGADGSGTTSSAIAAIYYAVNNGAQVINNSWGGPSYSQALHDALTYAYNQHVLVVSAAGNNASNNDVEVMYPANYPVPSNISVAATGDLDNLASFSNYGAKKVHLAAPGVVILSTTPNDTFRFMSGTSMAAPLVAGMAAMVLREAPSLTGYQVKSLILDSATYKNSLIGKVSSASRINAEALLLAAQGETYSLASQPSYSSSSAGRAPASSESGGGCGTVTSILAQQKFSSGGGRPMGGSAVMILIICALPIIAWLVLRRRDAKNRRKFDRFVMDSGIKVRMGERELVGQMKTISMGGLSFTADELLERGGTVSIQINSPDGTEQFQVQGHIVWSEDSKSYGVQFNDSRSYVKDAIREWTGKLIKAN